MDFFSGTAHQFQVGLNEINKKNASNTDKSIRRKSISHKHEAEQDHTFYSGVKDPLKLWGRGGGWQGWTEERNGGDNKSLFLL